MRVDYLSARRQLREWCEETERNDMNCEDDIREFSGVEEMMMMMMMMMLLTGLQGSGTSRILQDGWYTMDLTVVMGFIRVSGPRSPTYIFFKFSIFFGSFPTGKMQWRL